MKRIVLLLLLIVSTSIFAQKQIGYVRTIQKANKPAVYLKGVEIITKENKNGTKSGDGGYYEIPVGVVNGKKGYTITSVKKVGYALVDEKELCVFQERNVSPKDIVMISKIDEVRYTKILEKKLRDKIEKEYMKKMAEVKESVKEMETVENMYKKQLENLPEAVKKLVYLDYKNLTDSLDIAIAEAYENADFAKAVELIDKKPSLKKRSEQNKQLREALEKEKEAIIRECSIKIDYFKSIYQKDSALYYMELRLEQEPENASFLNEMGVYLREFYANYSKALDCFNKALEINISMFGENNYKTAMNYNNIGLVYSSIGQLDNAMYNFNKALNFYLSNREGNDTAIASIYHNKGIVFSKLAQNDKALDCYNKALEIEIPIFGEKHPSVASTYNNIALVYSDYGQYDKALDCYNKALNNYISAYSERYPDVAKCYANIGNVFLDKGLYHRAFECFNKALEISLSNFGEKHPSVAANYGALGQAYCLNKQYEKALDCFAKALEINISTYGRNSSNVAMNYDNIGSVYYFQGQYDKALEYYSDALEIAISVFGEDHPYVAKVYYNIGLVYYALGEYNKADEYSGKMNNAWKRNNK